MDYILELEDGVYSASGYGDPSRTLVKKNAERFQCRRSALLKLEHIRKYYPRKGWREAKVIEFSD